jgi:lipid A 4'-phosphatase
MRQTARYELALLAGSIGLGLLFVLAAGVDLWFADLFFSPGAGFYMKDATWVSFLYGVVHPLAAVLILGLLGLLVFNLLRRRAVGPFTTRALLYLLAVLALGPGLVVNGVFKEHWGRARPRDVVEFGGTREFTPAFVISDQCDRNCSFVSGHASIPFALAAFVFLLRRRRKLVLGAALAFGGLVGLARIAAGAHFLSDVIFSGVFVFLVAYLLARYVFRLATGPEVAGV